VSRGNQVSAGVVEVKINGKWGSICDQGWSDRNTGNFQTAHFFSSVEMDSFYLVCFLMYMYAVVVLWITIQ
jgi:hypothetical protein